MPNKTALVTGGTKGIGRAIVRALEDNGYKVAVVSREAGVDLSKPEARYRLIERCVAQLGGLDVLVNNAGCQSHGGALYFSPDDWNYQLELMLTAPFDLSQQAARHMSKNFGGHIINILSTAAFQGARNIVGYVAAKHGLLGLTRALSIEWAPDIHINAVAPGLVDTDMTKDITPERKEFLNSITPSGRFSTPEEIAESVLFLVNSRNIYGQTIVCDGGWLSKNG